MGAGLGVVLTAGRSMRPAQSAALKRGLSFFCERGERFEAIFAFQSASIAVELARETSFQRKVARCVDRFEGGGDGDWGC